MSHIAKIEFEENWNVETLKNMCKVEKDFEWIENKKTYNWWGYHVGDYPIPNGFTKEDLGSCDHVIKVDGASYEIGVVNKNGKTHLLWDFYYTGGLQQALGKGAEKLKQCYSLAKVRQEAMMKGKIFQESKRNGYREIVINM